MVAIAGIALAGAVVLAVRASSTGQSGAAVASVASPSPAASASGSPAQRGPIAYASCMRAHGVSNFPDPNSNGTILLPQGTDLLSPQFQSAQQACQSLRPAGAAGPPGAQDQQKSVQYAACIRAHGYPDFPDPTVTGNGFTVDFPSDVDPLSPQFRAAQQACQAYNVLPGGAP